MNIHQFSTIPEGLYLCGLKLDCWRGSLSRKKLPLPVISIGNLTFGGTGKTPLLFRLLNDLLKIGITPLVLTRGYQGFFQRQIKSGIILTGEDAALNQQSDEVRLLADKFPHVLIGVGANRYANALKLLQLVPRGVFLLDDGFQHWDLDRDLDIVCVDATLDLDHARLLPIGPYREPLSALERAGCVIVTRTELVPELEREKICHKIRDYNSDAPILTSRFIFGFKRSDGVPQPLSALDRKKVLAISGIGNPGAFERNLSNLGAQVHPCRFQDHYAYSSLDIQKMEEQRKRISAMAVTTEKDWIKLKSQMTSSPQGFSENLYILEQKLSFVGDSEHLWQVNLDAFLKQHRLGKSV